MPGLGKTVLIALQDFTTSNAIAVAGTGVTVPPSANWTLGSALLLINALEGSNKLTSNTLTQLSNIKKRLLIAYLLSKHKTDGTGASVVDSESSSTFASYLDSDDSMREWVTNYFTNYEVIEKAVGAAMSADMETVMIASEYPHAPNAYNILNILSLKALADAQDKQNQGDAQGAINRLRVFKEANTAKQYLLIRSPVFRKESETCTGINDQMCGSSTTGAIGGTYGTGSTVLH